MTKSFIHSKITWTILSISGLICFYCGFNKPDFSIHYALSFMFFIWLSLFSYRKFLKSQQPKFFIWFHGLNFSIGSYGLGTLFYFFS